MPLVVSEADPAIGPLYWWHILDRAEAEAKIGRAAVDALDDLAEDVSADLEVSPVPIRLAEAVREAEVPAMLAEHDFMKEGAGWLGVAFPDYPAVILLADQPLADLEVVAVHEIKHKSDYRFRSQTYGRAYFETKAVAYTLEWERRGRKTISNQ